MDGFEELLERERSSIERYVRYKLNGTSDAQDIIQEVFLTAYQKFDQLKDTGAFKAWMISIAANKCRDYFRQKASKMELPIDELNVSEMSLSRYGLTVNETVQETLEKLGSKDKQILYLYFFKDMPQSEIAKALSIPIGTVKSRLHTAKQNFKSIYPHRTEIAKGGSNMKKLPKFMPEYKIEQVNKSPFSVKWEELMGWFLVPRLGEELSWGMYDMPSRLLDHVYDMKVTGKAKVHGIEGVELTARESSYSDKDDVIERTFIAQLTDTHCRYLATLRNDGDVRNYITFLDGDEFIPNWGFGQDNCGNETNLSVKGDIQRSGNTVTSVSKDFLLDIVGRYNVTINGKTYDTVCVMDIETYNSGVISEQFLDKNGRTILWRRFNRDNWKIDRYKKPWSELLPENDKLTINGTTYVHWYDCITDYIL